LAFLNYEYKMKISYSECVSKCYFTIKAIPINDFRQMSISYDISMHPATQYSKSNDSFGNTQIIGCENMPHKEFIFTIKGLVETQPVSITGGINQNTIGMYKYPHGKCIPGDKIKAFAEAMKSEVDSFYSTKEKCTFIMDKLFENMIYETGSTEIETTAEESFASGKGVCQDFAHIYICLLRLFHIPARYVCGLIVGEGQSHAWVEAACDDNFVAFDPTHNREVTDEYIAQQEAAATALAEAEDFDSALENSGATTSSSTYTKGDVESAYFDTAVIEAAEALEEGQVSGVVYVEGTGYYVIRIDSDYDEDATKAQINNLTSEKEGAFYEDTLASWKEAVVWSVDEAQWALVKYDVLFKAVEAEEAADAE